MQPELPARCADSEIIKTGSRRAGPQAETRRRIMIRTSDRLAVLSCSDPRPGGHDGTTSVAAAARGTVAAPARHRPDLIAAQWQGLMPLGRTVTVISGSTMATALAVQLEKVTYYITSALALRVGLREARDSEPASEGRTVRNDQRRPRLSTGSQSGLLCPGPPWSR